jgi:hypothetical protein
MNNNNNDDTLFDIHIQIIKQYDNGELDLGWGRRVMTMMICWCDNDDNECKWTNGWVNTLDGWMKTMMMQWRCVRWHSRQRQSVIGSGMEWSGVGRNKIIITVIINNWYDNLNMSSRVVVIQEERMKGTRRN